MIGWIIARPEWLATKFRTWRIARQRAAAESAAYFRDRKLANADMRRMMGLGTYLSRLRAKMGASTKS